MGFPKRTFDDLRLYFRYAYRRLGIPGYQIHQIYLPKQKLIYIPIPKNACTSIKHALHEIEFGKRFDSSLPEFRDYREHHDYYKKRRYAFTSITKLRKHDECTRFALIRDPVKRLISCYRNRVLDLGDLNKSKKAVIRAGLPIKPDLNTFVLNLKAYRRLNKSIRHHSRLQARFLGGTLDYLDRVFTLSDIAELLAILRTYNSNLELRRRKTGGTKVTLTNMSKDALQTAIKFYEDDYKLLSKYFSPHKIYEAHSRRQP